MTSQPFKNQPHAFESSLRGRVRICVGVPLATTCHSIAGLSTRSPSPDGGLCSSVPEARDGGAARYGRFLVRGALPGPRTPGFRSADHEPALQIKLG